MPNIAEFNIAINLQTITKTNDMLARAYEKSNDEGERAQLQSFIETLDLFEQARTLNDPKAAEYTLERARRLGLYNPDNKPSPGRIYGKLRLILSNDEENQEVVRDQITKQSDKDAKRLTKLRLELSDEIIEINDAGLAASQYFKESDKNAVDIHMITHYLTKAYELNFTQAQIDYINTQSSQDNLSGSISSMFPFNGMDATESVTVKNHYPVWKFDQNNNLHEISNEYDIVSHNPMTKEELKSGKAMVTADISALTTIPKEVVDETIPYNMPKNISFSYQSDNGLDLYISQSILDIDKSLLKKLQSFFRTNPPSTTPQKPVTSVNIINPLVGLSTEEREEMQKTLKERSLEEAKAAFSLQNMPGQTGTGYTEQKKDDKHHPLGKAQEALLRNREHSADNSGHNI